MSKRQLEFVEIGTSKKQKLFQGFPLDQLDNNVITQLLISGKATENDLEQLRRVNKKLYKAIQDPTTRRTLCRELKQYLSRLQTPTSILRYLRDSALNSPSGRRSILYVKTVDDVYLLTFTEEEETKDEKIALVYGFNEGDDGILRPAYNIEFIGTISFNADQTKRIQQLQNVYEKLDNIVLKKSVTIGDELEQDSSKENLKKATLPWGDQPKKPILFENYSEYNSYRIYSKGAQVRDNTFKKTNYCKSLFEASLME